MRGKRWLCASVLALSVAFANPIFAAPCAGFTDVDDTVVGTEFCQNVEWIRNRGVTLGCTSTTYCPGNPVSRLAMAAFMNRLGTALTPVIVFRFAHPGAIDLDSTWYLCGTGDLAPVPYNRTAVVTSSFAGNAEGPLEFNHDLVRSDNGGVSWWFFTADGVSEVRPHRGGTPLGLWTSSTITGTEVIPAGATYRFALRLWRHSGFANFSEGYCRVTVTAYSL